MAAPEGALQKLVQEIKDPRFLMHRVKNIVRNPEKREKLAAFMARFKERSADFQLNDKEAWLSKQITADGYAELPSLLNTTQCDQIVKYLLDKPAFNSYEDIYDADALETFFAPENAPENCPVARYHPDVVVHAPYVMDVVNNEMVLKLAEAHLGCKPQITSIGLGWSIAGQDRATHSQLFHRDCDDWKWIKMFIYLTDVTEASGPHEYVAGSHRQDMLTHKGRYTDSQVSNLFGEDRIKRLVGKAGTTIMEDTYGVHRGLMPKTQHRLMLTVQYSMGKTPYYPKEPPLSWRDYPDLDPYVNQYYVGD